MNKNFWYKIYIFCFGEIDRKYAINVLICFFIADSKRRKVENSVKRRYK